ncbi:hypothetical protein EVAR_3834_1 [Eumeta japonica]|uniref:Uncharacterized protein n=1 Tax=Eumeta variegata TaxID=151549 RepID=A0A4C1STA6_EUMVA|nr:hypothetical protein EVAR_3834_1 [Eumeta japonica]
MCKAYSRNKPSGEPSESRWPLPIIDTHNSRRSHRCVSGLLGRNTISKEKEIGLLEEGKGGVGQRNSNSLDETQQRKLLLHVRILEKRSTHVAEHVTVHTDRKPSVTEVQLTYEVDVMNALLMVKIIIVKSHICVIRRFTDSAPANEMLMTKVRASGRRAPARAPPLNIHEPAAPAPR